MLQCDMICRSRPTSLQNHPRLNTAVSFFDSSNLSRERKETVDFLPSKYTQQNEYHKFNLTPRGRQAWWIHVVIYEDRTIDKFVNMKNISEVAETKVAFNLHQEGNGKNAGSTLLIHEERTWTVA